MKRFSYILVFVVLLFGVVLGQTSEPTAWTSWYEYLQFYKTGATTLTNKTLTSPTIDGIATMDSVAVDSLNVSGQLVMATTAPIYFRDATEQIYSSVNGQLDIDATTEVEIATTTLDLNGALDVSGTITGAGAVSIDDVTDATNTTSGSIHTDGGVGIAKKVFIGTDLDVDGTANLDNTDIDGTLDVSGAITGSGTYDPTIATTTAGGERGINLAISHDTNALTGTVTGVRGNARVNVESAAGTAVGGEFLSGNMSAGYSLANATGVYSGVTNKVPSGAVTWTNARAFEANMDLDQGTAGNTNTITNAYMFYGNYNLPTAGSYATVTNGYGIFVRNEAVGGTGQMLDAAFYADDLNHSGGIKGWDYGLDFSGITANFGTADIRFSDGGLINNPHADTLKVTEAVFQVNGGLAIGSSPTMTITAIDTVGASGKWVKLTVAGVDFYAIADTSAIP
jgi:hypothetical protein